MYSSMADRIQELLPFVHETSVGETLAFQVIRAKANFRTLYYS
ncbi:hypothetical protein ACHAXN_002994 [Cyclotella atomus]